MRRMPWWGVLAVVGLLAWVLWTDRSSDAPSSDPSTPTGSSSVAWLPPEAVETLALIDEGGPFPHDRDGTVFMNRERLLPQHPSGYWREYTVPTPGESDRGARRLVRGDGGETYYTDDHYRSFRRVPEGAG